MQYQHTINCLSDSNMRTRKKTIEKLSNDIKKQIISVDILSQFFLECLYQPLLKSIVDSYDSVRENSINLLQYILNHIELFNNENYIKFIDDIIPIINERLGKLPFPEQQEENRFGVYYYIFSYYN